MYQPVFSLKTGWVLGEITDHTAHPINDSVRLDEICTRLNAAQDNIERNDSAAGIPKVSLPDGEHNKSSFQFPKEVEAFNDIGIQHWMGRPEDNESIGAHKMYLYFSRKLNT